MFRHYVPTWLLPLIGERERRILSNPDTRIFQVDQDGQRLKPWQQVIESPSGESFTIDAKRRQIIG